MATEVTLEVLIFALVFTMFTTHQTRGEPDCYCQKDLVLYKRKYSIKNLVDYIGLDSTCRELVEECDMTCICQILTMEDEKTVSIDKILCLARNCNKPVLAESIRGSK
jgi:hypothetical protein